MSTPYLTATSSDAEILEVIRKASRASDNGWVSVRRPTEGSPFLDRLTDLVDRGELRMKFGWKNHARKGALGLGDNLVGYDKDVLLFQLSHP